MSSNDFDTPLPFFPETDSEVIATAVARSEELSANRADVESRVAAGSDPNYATTREAFDGYSHPDLYAAVQSLRPGEVSATAGVWSDVAGDVSRLCVSLLLRVLNEIGDNWDGPTADSVSRTVRQVNENGNGTVNVMNSVSTRLNQASMVAEALKATVPPPVTPLPLPMDVITGGAATAYADAQQLAEEERRRAIDVLDTVYSPQLRPTGDAVPAFGSSNGASGADTGGWSGGGTGTGTAAPAGTSNPWGSGAGTGGGGSDSADPSTPAETRAAAAGENAGVAPGPSAGANGPSAGTGSGQGPGSTPASSTSGSTTSPAATSPAAFAGGTPRSGQSTAGGRGGIGGSGAGSGGVGGGAGAGSSPGPSGSGALTGAGAGIPAVGGAGSGGSGAGMRSGYMPAGMMPGAARGAGDGDDEHRAASYLVHGENQNELVGELPPTVIPVLGE